MSNAGFSFYLNFRNEYIKLVALTPTPRIKIRPGNKTQ